MSISSIFLITDVKAESLEESFKNTPLPFWDIETQTSMVQYGTNTQDILFNYGEWLEDFSDISDWVLLSGNGEFYGNRENIIIITPHDSVYTWVYTNILNGISIQNCYYEIHYSFNYTGVLAICYINLYKDIDMSGGLAYQILIPDGEQDEWQIEADFIFDSDIVKSIGLGIKSSNPTISLKIEVDYIHFWREYQEDMSDVTDWEYFDSNGLVEGEYDFKSDNEISECWIICNDEGNEYVAYNILMDYEITSKTKFKAKTKVESAFVTVKLQLLGIGLDDYPVSHISTSWRIDNTVISDHAGKTINNLILYVDDTNDGTNTGNYSAYFDYIEIWEEGGIFDVSISIQQFKNQKFEFMLDTDDLTEYTKLDFGIFQNDNEMNYDFSLENQTFMQRDFEFDYSGYNYLRFKLDLKYSTNYFKLSCYDENNSKIFDNLIFEYVRKLGNNLKIQSDNFTGWFHLYYFMGDVDYLTIWKETIINQDPNIETYQLSASALGNNMLTEHEINYNRYITNFQFLRTNLIYDTEFSQSLLIYTGVIIDIQFYKSDGSKFYRINGQMDRVYTDLRFYVRIYETVDGIESQIFMSACGSNEGIASMLGDLKFAVWRAQDNHLGMFFIAGTLFDDNILGNPRFLSNKTLENFQANITITYFSEAFDSGYRNFIIELNGFELGHGGTEGVAEPHFSTTWWDSIPIVGPIINAFMIAGDVIISAIQMGLLPITGFLDSLFGAIGGLAGGIWILFEASLSAMGVSIDAIAGDIFAFFNGILDAISGAIDDIFASILNIADNFVIWLGDGINLYLIPAIIEGLSNLVEAVVGLLVIELNLVGNAIGWGDVGTFFFDAVNSTVITVPSWLNFVVGVVNWMVGGIVYVNSLITDFGPMLLYWGMVLIAIDVISSVITLDTDEIMSMVARYGNVIEKIVTFMFNLISAILNAVWGILPF